MHASIRSRVIFPRPTALPNLQTAASSSRRPSCSRRRRQVVSAHCCHPRYAGARAWLPPPLPRSRCGPWSAAGDRRSPRFGRPTRGGRMLASQQPAGTCFAACVRPTALPRLPSLESASEDIVLPQAISMRTCVWVRVTCRLRCLHSDPLRRRRRGGSQVERRPEGSHKLERAYERVTADHIYLAAGQSKSPLFSFLSPNAPRVCVCAPVATF